MLSTAGVTATPAEAAPYCVTRPPSTSRTALTLKVYSVPLARPVTVWPVSALPVAVQVAPSSLLYCQPVARNTSSQERTTRRSPARAVKLGGAAGKMAEIGGGAPVKRSTMVTVSEIGLPAVTPEGRLAVSMATVKVSLSPSASWWVGMVAEPVVSPAAMATLDKVPWSPSSLLPRVTVSGMATAPDRAVERVARTVTARPSGTGLGSASGVTVAPVWGAFWPPAPPGVVAETSAEAGPAPAGLIARSSRV